MLTIAPTSNDFGDAVLLTPQENKMFLVTVPRGIADSVRISITGAGAADFKADASTPYLLPPVGAANGPTCRSNWPDMPVSAVTPKLRPATECEVWVAFIPRTLGPKRANLVVTEPGGATLTAALTGNGVKGCAYAVVSCNYAFMYSGNISWTESNSGPAGSFKSNVNVSVKNGVGVCNGSATEVSISPGGNTSKTGAITGKALVAVEFDFYEELEVRDDSLPAKLPSQRRDRGRSIPLGYKVTAACPSADWPAGPNGEAATPSTPAELDGRERSSYPQRATALMQKEMKGSNSASPEDDAVNGVKSSLEVNWLLKRP